MEYVLPLRVGAGADTSELARYLNGVTAVADVIVVDGSEQAVFDRNRKRLDDRIRHVRPLPELRCRNGKVAGVLTGLRMCRGDKVIVADDDVRYELHQIFRLEYELDDADVVRPQNYFHPLPWHAHWDTARILLNRAFGTDYPGTLAIRLTDALRVHGYDGEVLFENLELIRTVKASGGRERVLLDLHVRRRPPDARHFWSQRLRQAYDSNAQPARMLAELGILPLIIAVLRRPILGRVIAAAGLPLVAAEFGRRRAGGSRCFPPTSLLWVAPWLLERGCCAWIALILRLSGRGVPYAGQRFTRAATSTRRLTRRDRAVGPACVSHRRTA